MDPANALPDWEAFYANYKQPGYVPGFEITSKLGGGMFGLVFKARKQSIGKDYAIKFLKVDDGEVRRAVLAELEQVKYFAQVDHPNLVSIEDRGEADGIPYLVMAYAGAETLKDRLPGKPEARDELLRYVLQACRGVAALHERSLVHFDLKPANVFLKGGVARVGDYGLSKLVTHSRGSLSMGRGTPYYMAPEMLQRRGDVRSDIYSLGVVLYECLCGEVPFKGDSEWEVLRKHEHEAPVFPPHVGGRERAAIARCLQKDPDQRFQSVGELIAALGTPALVEVAPAAVEPVAAPVAAASTPPPPEPLPRPTRRRGALRAIAAMAVMFVVFATFVSRGSHRQVWANSQATRVATPRRGAASPQPSSFAAALHEFGRSVAANLVEAQKRRRSVDLHSLTLSQLELPVDLHDYADELGPLVGGEFSPGQGQKLERDGRPVILAAVELLQQYDYSEREDCRRAFVLHQFLQQATQFTDFGVARPRGEIDAVTSLRFRIVADAWRRFAETWCKDDGVYQRALEATGKRESRPN